MEDFGVLLEAAGADTKAVKSKVYPLVEKALNNSTNIGKYRKVVSETIEKRQKELFDIAPMNNIYFTEYDNPSVISLGSIPKAL